MRNTVDKDPQITYNGFTKSFYDTQPQLSIHLIFMFFSYLDVT